MKTFTSVIAIFKFSLLFSFAIANPFKSAISCDESAPSKFRVPQQRPIVDSHVSTDALDPSMLPQVFTLFTQEDCVFDAAQSRCNTSPQPSYPVWTGELIGVPQLAVDFTSTKTKALLYLRDGYLVLADSTTPKIYTISHLNPMSRINGAPLDIGPCFGYVRSDYPDYRYPQFDIYSLPDNTSVGIKQRSTPAQQVLVKTDGPNGGDLIIQQNPQTLNPFTQDWMNSYLVVHNVDGSLFTFPVNGTS